MNYAWALSKKELPLLHFWLLLHFLLWNLSVPGTKWTWHFKAMHFSCSFFFFKKKLLDMLLFMGPPWSISRNEWLSVHCAWRCARSFQSRQGLQVLMKGEPLSGLPLFSHFITCYPRPLHLHAPVSVQKIKKSVFLSRGANFAYWARLQQLIHCLRETFPCFLFQSRKTQNKCY